ncbi:MAG: glycosyltransferase family 4 protein [Candidatus Zixiibacteriota bacterium]
MAERFRLLILTHNFPRFQGDFAGVFIHLLARRLTDHGIDPVILAPHDPGALEYEKWDNVTIYRFRYAKRDEDESIAYRGNMHQLVLGSVTGIFKFKAFLDAYREAAFRIIDTERISVVAGHWLIPSGIVMKSIEAKFHLPMILSSHGTDIRLMSKYLQMARRYFHSFFPKLKAWTVVSSYLRDEILRVEPTLAPILQILPLPHDETLFYRDENIAREPNLVVAVTRFAEQKRVGHLIRAFALVTEQQPKARLELYASGPMQAEIEALIAKLGLKETVTIFAPIPQEQLRTVYNRAGMVVLNSFQEGFGLALSEAMLCGAPVIGVASGGIVDIIRHDDTGLLVPPDNVDALTKAMLRVMSDDPLRSCLAVNGHEFALKSYASGPLAAKFAELVRGARRL